METREMLSKIINEYEESSIIFEKDIRSLCLKFQRVLPIIRGRALLLVPQCTEVHNECSRTTALNQLRQRALWVVCGNCFSRNEDCLVREPHTLRLLLQKSLPRSPHDQG